MQAPYAKPKHAGFDSDENGVYFYVSHSLFLTGTILIAAWGLFNAVMFLGAMVLINKAIVAFLMAFSMFIGFYIASEMAKPFIFYLFVTIVGKMHLRKIPEEMRRQIDGGSYITVGADKMREAKGVVSIAANAEVMGTLPNTDVSTPAISKLKRGEER